VTPRSLRLRLILAAAGLILLALALAGFGLRAVFDSVLDRRTVEELDRTARSLAGQAEIGPEGHVSVPRPPGDPRQANAYGGLYWQIEWQDLAGDQRLRSRSLWDVALDLPPGTLPVPGAGRRVLDLPGPQNSRLLAVVRQVRILRSSASQSLVIVVALDRAELAASRAAFLELLMPALAGLGLVLVLAMTLFVHRALLPFRGLRAALRALHEGQVSALPGNFPDEVQPLADDLNRLAALQAAAVERARAGAADLAHGLKTPLAVLDALARRARTSGQVELGGEIEAQAALMARQVERVLARARSASAGTLRRARCAPAPLVEKLVSLLQRLPGDRLLAWEILVPSQATLPVEGEDLTEMLGNLLDNARKWANGRVRVTAGAGFLAVEDDGPGMAEAEMQEIARGQRWDESRPGSGFGLAITRDLCEATGGRLELSNSRLGGLRAALSWSREHDPA